MSYGYTPNSVMHAGNTDLLRPVTNPIDKKSRQVINQEITVAQLGRTKVKNGGAFNESMANTSLEKHLKRKKKAYPVMFLVDRMRFTKKGYHEYLNYRNIEHFYQPYSHPDAFMLYVRHDNKNRKTYETYKCMNSTDVDRVKDLIFTAGHDPKKILQDSTYRTNPDLNYVPPPTTVVNNNVSSSRQTSLTDSTSSSEYYIERRPNSRMSRPRSLAQIPTYQTQYYQPVQQSPVVVYSRPQSRAPSAEPRIEYVRAPTVYQSNPYLPDRQSFAPEDITYLRTDNINGPQIMDNGPVYMYVSRSRTHLNRSSPQFDSAPGYYRTTYYN